MTALLKPARLTIIIPRQYVRPAETLFAAMAGAGSEPSDDRKAHIDLTMRKLIDAGVWAALDNLWVFRAETQTQAGVNWKKPTGPRITPVNSPTFTEDVGYKGDGLSSYLSTGAYPRASSDNSLFCEVITASNATAQDIRANSINDRYVVRVNTTNVSARVMASSGPGYTFSGETAPYFCLASRSLATTSLHVNGNFVASLALGGTDVRTDEIMILGRPSPAAYSDRPLGMAGSAASITTAQATAFYDLYQAYIAGL